MFQYLTKVSGIKHFISSSKIAETAEYFEVDDPKKNKQIYTKSSIDMSVNIGYNKKSPIQSLRCIKHISKIVVSHTDKQIHQSAQ